MTIHVSFTVNEVVPSLFGGYVHVASFDDEQAYFACAEALEELAKSRDVSVRAYQQEEEEFL